MTRLAKRSRRISALTCIFVRAPASVKRYLSNFIKNMAAYKQKEDKKRDRKLELKARRQLASEKRQKEKEEAERRKNEVVPESVRSFAKVGQLTKHSLAVYLSLIHI